MVQIAYHCSHEPFKPSRLLQLVKLAEKHGFTAIHSSEHFSPWNSRQGESGHAFSWLGAAMQVSKLPFNLVCTPGYRYLPAILAQAIATLCELFPGRFEMTLGSGEAINESITGEPWPDKSARNNRLRAAYRIIKELLMGRTVTESEPVKVQHARLHTFPEVLPPLYGAAISVQTAGWMGSWTDGLLTAHQPPDVLRSVVDAYRKNGGAHKPLRLKVQISYAKSYQQALDGAFEQWKTNIFPSAVLANLPTMEQFESLAQIVEPLELLEAVHVSADAEAHIDWLNKYIELGFDELILHNVNADQETFIQDFGRSVLPRLNL